MKKVEVRVFDELLFFCVELCSGMIAVNTEFGFVINLSRLYALYDGE